MSKLQNLIKWAKVTLPDNDGDLWSRSQVKSIGEVPKKPVALYPYGMAAVAPVGSVGAIFNISSQEENTFAILSNPDLRFKNLKIGEVKMGNFVKGNNIYFRESGLTEINGSEFEGLIKIVDLTGKINDYVTEFNSFVTVFNTHQHTETGSVTSSPLTTATNATSFSKSDYENESAKHGFTSISGAPSGGGNGILNLNGLTAQVQSFATGTGGSDFNIASAGSTHTFNLPTASGAKRGALSSADWTTFNNKLSNISGQDHSTLANKDYASAGHTGFEKALTFSTGLTRAGDTITTNDSQIVHNNLSGKQGGIASQYFHLTNAQHTIATQQSTGSQDGYLLSADWNTFNGKLDNIVEDTTPQLGGTLDAQEFAIDNVGDITHDDATASDWIFRNSDLDKFTRFFGNDGGVDTELLTLDHANGFVGINQPVPTRLLHIKGNPATSLWEDSVGGNIFALAVDSFGNSFIGPKTDTTLRFLVNDIPAIRIQTSSGNYNVSVGNFNANEKFQVDGNISLKDDNDKLLLGTGKDAEIYVNSNDDLYIKNVTQDKDTIFNVNDGGVDTEVFKIYGDPGGAGFSAQFNNFNLLINGAGLNFKREGASVSSLGTVYSSASASHNAGFLFVRGRGTEASPLAVQNGDDIGFIRFNPYNGISAPRQGEIIGCATETHSATNRGLRIVFSATPTGTNTRLNYVALDEGGISLLQNAGIADAAVAKFEEKDTTPANPADGTEVKMYMKADKIIFQYNQAGTIRYKYLDLTGTGVTWQHTTTAP